METLLDFWKTTGFTTLSGGNWLMILVSFFFIYLAIAKDYEPLLLLPDRIRNPFGKCGSIHSGHAFGLQG